MCIFFTATLLNLVQCHVCMFIQIYFSSLNRHLIMVEGFEHPNYPRSYVVQGLMPLVGPPKANRS